MPKVKGTQLNSTRNQVGVTAVNWSGSGHTGTDKIDETRAALQTNKFRKMKTNRRDDAHKANKKSNLY